MQLFFTTKLFNIQEIEKNPSKLLNGAISIGLLCFYHGIYFFILVKLSVSLADQGRI